MATLLPGVCDLAASPCGSGRRPPTERVPVFVDGHCMAHPIMLTLSGLRAPESSLPERFGTPAIIGPVWSSSCCYQLGSGARESETQEVLARPSRRRRGSLSSGQADTPRSDRLGSPRPAAVPHCPRGSPSTRASQRAKSGLLQSVGLLPLPGQLVESSEQARRRAIRYGFEVLVFDLTVGVGAGKLGLAALPHARSISVADPRR